MIAQFLFWTNLINVRSFCGLCFLELLHFHRALLARIPGAGWEGFPEWAIRIPNKPGGLKPIKTPWVTTDYARGTSCLCAQQLHTICFAVRLPGLEREGNWPGKMMKSHEIIRWNGDEWGIRIRRILSSDTVERCWKRVSRPGAPVPDHASSNATKEGKTEKSKQNLKNAAKDLGKWRMQVHHTGLWVLPVQKPVVMSQVTSIELLILLQILLSSLTCARQVHCVSFRSHPALQPRQLCQDNTPMSVNNYRLYIESRKQKGLSTKRMTNGRVSQTWVASSKVPLWLQSFPRSNTYHQPPSSFRPHAESFRVRLRTIRIEQLLKESMELHQDVQAARLGQGDARYEHDTNLYADENVFPIVSLFLTGDIMWFSLF